MIRFYGFIMFLHGYACLELQSYVACYGNTGLDNFLQPRCASGESIAVVGLSALAKEISTGCPVEDTPFNSVPDSCCEYNPKDCYVRYDVASYKAYYQRCNGNPDCTIGVSWTNSPCNDTIYLERTNYMKIDFYCVADQGLDPCSDFKTTDNRVFLWNSGYPTSSLSGSSTCTCSVEASCDSKVKVTAIDLRLASPGACNQSISITDGASTTTFDCSSNNEYLPVVLYISSSHFIRMQILNDYLGTPGGYYLLLLEGTSSGSELTLSCSSTAETTPTIPASSLPVCPDGESTTERTTVIQTSTVNMKSTLTTNGNTGTSMSEPTPTDMTKASSESDTVTTATINTKTTPLNGLSNPSASPLMDRTTITLSEGSSVSAMLMTDDKATFTGHTTESSDAHTGPTFVSLGWTSTEKVMTGISTTGDMTGLSTKGDITGSSVLATVMTDTTDVSSLLGTGSTTSTSLSVTEKSSESNNKSIIIGIAVVLIVLLAIILVLVYYRDKLKECCCKSKNSSKVDISDQESVDNPLFAYFHENLNDRMKPNQLPPLMQTLKLQPTSHQFRLKHYEKEEKETKQKKKKTKKTASESKVKNKKEKPKKRSIKTPLTKDNDEDYRFTPRKNSYSKSAFPATISGILGDVNALKRERMMSIIDISNSQGQFEKSVEIVDKEKPSYL